MDTTIRPEESLQSRKYYTTRGSQESSNRIGRFSMDVSKEIKEIKVIQVRSFIENFEGKSFSRDQVVVYLNSVFKDCNRKLTELILGMVYRELSNTEVKVLNRKVDQLEEGGEEDDEKYVLFKRCLRNEHNVRVGMLELNEEVGKEKVEVGIVVKKDEVGRGESKKKFKRKFSTEVPQLNLEGVSGSSHDLLHLSSRKKFSQIENKSRLGEGKNSVKRMSEPVKKEGGQEMIGEEEMRRIKNSTITSTLVNTTMELIEEKEEVLYESFCHGIGLSSVGLKSKSEYMVPENAKDLLTTTVVVKIMEELKEEGLLFKKYSINLGHLLKGFYALYKVHNPNPDVKKGQLTVVDIMVEEVLRIELKDLSRIYGKLQSMEVVNLKETIMVLSKGGGNKVEYWEGVLRFMNELEMVCLSQIQKHDYPIELKDRSGMRAVKHSDDVLKSSRKVLQDFVGWKVKYDMGFAEEVHKVELKMKSSRLSPHKSPHKK